MPWYVQVFNVWLLDNVFPRFRFRFQCRICWYSWKGLVQRTRKTGDQGEPVGRTNEGVMPHALLPLYTVPISSPLSHHRDSERGSTLTRTTLTAAPRLAAAAKAPHGKVDGARRGRLDGSIAQGGSFGGAADACVVDGAAGLERGGYVVAQRRVREEAEARAQVLRRR